MSKLTDEEFKRLRDIQMTEDEWKKVPAIVAHEKYLTEYYEEEKKNLTEWVKMFERHRMGHYPLKRIERIAKELPIMGFLTLNKKEYSSVGYEDKLSRLIVKAFEGEDADTNSDDEDGVDDLVRHYNPVDLTKEEQGLFYTSYSKEECYNILSFLYAQERLRLSTIRNNRCENDTDVYNRCRNNAVFDGFCWDCLPERKKPTKNYMKTLTLKCDVADCRNLVMTRKPYPKFHYCWKHDGNPMVVGSVRPSVKN